MRFRLSTLMIVLALGPPLATCPWWFEKSGWTVHSAAGAVAVATYPIAVLLLAAQFRRLPRHWLQEPPKYTSLALATIIFAALAAAACLVFFLTPADRKGDQSRGEDIRASIGFALAIGRR